MGYESKIIVVDRHEHEAKNGLPGWVYGDELARFNLCKMGYDRFDGVLFRELFTVPVDFDLYVNNEELDKTDPPEYWREDMYGERCKYTTDINRVISWLGQSEQHDHYRCAALFIDFLRALKEHESEYRQICLVHYGY